jgi:hypothetical protein
LLGGQLCVRRDDGHPLARGHVGQDSGEQLDGTSGEDELFVVILDEQADLAWPIG